jgi:hypothetical protein
LVGGIVELPDPVLQGPAQGSGQPEHPSVIMVPDGQHHGTAGLQRGDRHIEVVAERDGVEV